MRSKFLIVILCVLCSSGFYYVQIVASNTIEEDHCVFNKVFGEVPLDSSLAYDTPANIQSSVDKGLKWLEKAQHPDGGWGAGFHNNQREMDPHKVAVDPATTAMVSMAILRTGSTLEKGQYAKQLAKSTEYLLNVMETCVPNGTKITNLQGTQIQRKLGENIDLVLTTQFLTNLLDVLEKESKFYQRVFRSVNMGVDMVQTNLDAQGRTKGAGWAGVLQSAYATSVLESGQAAGAWVDENKLEKSKEYQRGNYNPVSEKTETRDGAGVMLYAVSGSARANAKQARKANELILEAKDKGVLDEVVVSYDNLKKIGVPEEEALILDAANQVFQSAAVKAQDKNVMSGFGNNGGEEFMSFLQTGESLVIANDNSWSKWYDSMSANLLDIQNNDGSWNGHHCITSPVYCTATCLMILSINNDIDNLIQIGQ